MCVCVCVARSSLLHTYWVYVATDGHRDVNQFAVKLTDWAMREEDGRRREARKEQRLCAPLHCALQESN